MVLVDSLVFPDLIMVIILTIVALILIIYLTSLLVKLSIINYRASISAFLFSKCLDGGISGVNYLNHVTITEDKLLSGNYLIICPRITGSGYDINVTVYIAYVR